MNPVPYILCAAGAFAIGGAWFNWEWFMGSRKARFFVRVFGRNGARAFYALLGLALVALGVLLIAGVIPTEKRV